MLNKAFLNLETRDVDPFVTEARIRSVFWIIGPILAAILAFTTRYFINGDAMTYIEMGEAVVKGEFRALANLTYSPAYPVLLGLAQTVLHTNPINELQLLKCVNFLCFLLAMACGDWLIRLAKRDMDRLRTLGEHPMPGWIFSALCYSMFLVAGLVLVRLRLINPDLLVFSMVLLVTGVLIWIREEPSRLLKYVYLGAATGVGYLSKSFFLLFSPVFFVLAALSAGCVRRAIPRVVVAIAIMLIIASPLIGALSNRLGRFTYGELGKHVYALWISGQGEPIYPKVINEKPKTILYEYDIPSTRPSGFDNCYWYEGFRPRFDLSVHLPIVAWNVVDVFIQIPWLLLILLWYGAQLKLGSARAGNLYPPSVVMLTAAVSLAGTGVYCLLRVEPRYIASFLFLGFMALAMSIRFPQDKSGHGRAMRLSSLGLVCFFLGLVIYSIIDQSIRSLQSHGPRPSYKEAFLENIAVKDFLVKRGISQGDNIAIVGSPPVNWARMAGVRIIAEIPETEQVLSATGDEQRAATIALDKYRIKAMVVRDSRFGEKSGQEWIPVDGTRDYFVQQLSDRQPHTKAEP
jgi:hypothetical protein